MSPEKARSVRKKGYDDALEFATLIGVTNSIKIKEGDTPEQKALFKYDGAN